MLRNFLFLILVSGGLSIVSGRIVSSPAGTFRGKVLRTPNGRRYDSFRGIPYAQPPVGVLRFDKPQPMPPLQGTFNATDYGPICVQPFNQPDRGQEDCLSLNVFTPFQGRCCSNSLKPVLVFLHGGGLGISGSSKISGLPGNLVTKGDIVVVTLNYRLGWFGFLRGNPDRGVVGNQALWDMILALQWVKDNIGAFGGDADSVTLSGQSGGGMLASLLSISPLAQGLFDQVIFLSGSFVEFPYPPTTSTDLLIAAANQVGCPVSDPLDVNAVTDCLINLPALDFDINLDLVDFFLAAQDEIFPRSPEELRRDPDYLRSVGFFDRNYLLSSTKDDGILFVNSNAHMPNISTPEATNNYIAFQFFTTPEGAAQFLEPYRNLYPGNEEEAVTALFSDFFILQNIDFLTAFTNTTEAVEGDAYLMSFDHEPSYIQDNLVVHGLDLLYLFDLSPQGLLDIYYSSFSLQGSFRRRDRRLRRSFTDLIIDFIRTGNPGTALSTQFNLNWEPYDAALKNYLSFSTSPELAQDLINRRFTAN